VITHVTRRTKAQIPPTQSRSPAGLQKKDGTLETSKLPYRKTSPASAGFLFSVARHEGSWFQSRGSTRRLAASVRAWDRLGEGKLLGSSASEHKEPAEPRRKLGGLCFRRNKP
jgi:hypothetical protein